MNDVGEPCAGEPHARFDRGPLATTEQTCEDAGPRRQLEHAATMAWSGPPPQQSTALPQAPTFAAWRAALGEGRLARDLMGEDPDDDVLDPYGQSLAEHRATVRELDRLTATIAHSIAAWHHP